MQRSTRHRRHFGHLTPTSSLRQSSYQGRGLRCYRSPTRTCLGLQPCQTMSGRILGESDFCFLVIHASILGDIGIWPFFFVLFDFKQHLQTCKALSGNIVYCSKLVWRNWRIEVELCCCTQHHQTCRELKQCSYHILRRNDLSEWQKTKCKLEKYGQSRDIFNDIKPVCGLTGQSRP